MENEEIYNTTIYILYIFMFTHNIMSLEIRLGNKVR